MAMANEIVPTEYQTFLQNIKTQVQQAQLKAVMAVNKELILLYWHIGKEILKRQEIEGWGMGVIDRLSADLHATFPQMRGFSARNLGYMKVFAKTYPDETILQTLSAKLTWSHNIALLDKVRDEKERLWYMQKAIEHGWSLSILEIQIETKLFHRQGKALTNFQITLPALDSDLAQYVLKDPYVFDFITTGEESKERNLQEALIANIRRFLLELGTGFTFVGSDYHIVVGGDDFYLDLLFYHLTLHCYVVIELKTVEFKPEHAGKLNFYLTAVDKQIKSSDDKPSIGILLCKGKNRIKVEYALNDMKKPIGVASCTTALPEELQDKLPNIKELEERLEKIAVKDMKG
jgi:predicted nuclease of restriction endonuclease-like (RecB) superfamily